MSKRIVVTGANKGIGLATVRRILAEHSDAHVFLGSRARERGEQARRSLLAEHPGWEDRLDVLALDVSDDASVAAAAASLARRYADEKTPLYGLVNNAGIGLGATSLAKVLDVNTYGVRRVCEAFVPLLDPDRGRVVIVSSAAGPNFVAGCSEEKRRLLLDPTLRWEALDAFMRRCLELEGPAAFEAEGLGEGSAYGLSKASVNAYMQILARERPELKVNACTPGWIETDLTRPSAAQRGKTPAELGMKTPHEGASATLHLLFAPLEGNGWYYGSDAERSPLYRYRSPGDPPYIGEG